MPWVSIEPKRIPDLVLFGYEYIGDTIIGTEEGAWYYHQEKGRVFVSHTNPRVWVDDLADAGQIGAKGITQGS